MRQRAAILTVLLIACAGDLRGQTGSVQANGRKQPPPSKPAEIPEKHKAATLEFINDNHHELFELLSQLRTMRPAEYDQAIRELYPISRSLDELKRRDRRRYSAGLAVWKAKSRVVLLAAKLACAPEAGLDREELKRQLRAGVREQLDAEIAQQKLECIVAEEQVKRLKANVERMESSHAKLLEKRFQSLLGESETARAKYTK
ncbi:hypothetical protein ACYOEI_04415 [Singulisphaera rosea]